MHFSLFFFFFLFGFGKRWMRCHESELGQLLFLGRTAWIPNPVRCFSLLEIDDLTFDQPITGIWLLENYLRLSKRKWVGKCFSLAHYDHGPRWSRLLAHTQSHSLLTKQLCYGQDLFHKCYLVDNHFQLTVKITFIFYHSEFATSASCVFKFIHF